MDLYGGEELTTVRIEDVVVSKSHVFALSKVSGEKSDWPLLQFLRFRNGKILELSPFYWDTATLLPRMRASQ